MYVGGTLISSVEFHGNMSLFIFMSKCPLACRYCHNVELLEDDTQKTFEEIKSEIDNASDFIDAVVISGGEPLMQLDAIMEIFTYVKSVNLKLNLILAVFIRKKLKNCSNWNYWISYLWILKRLSKSIGKSQDPMLVHK